MHRTVPIPEATKDLSRLITQALAGDEVILTDAGRPVARLVPIVELTQARTPGLNKGEVSVSDDFDAPLPDAFWLGDA
jgi:prevent-host-death family protein